MSHISESFPENIIKKMHYFYTDYIIDPPPNGALFRAKTEDAMITVYRSKKVLFQGKNPEKEAAIWQTYTNEKQATQVKQTNKQKTDRDVTLQIVQDSHIGSDESGTGDYFGPVTACAVYINADQIKTLQAMGVQDSKAIQDDTIKQLVKKIVAMNIPYSSVVLSNEKYNVLQKRGWSQGKMKAMLHDTAIRNVREKINDQSEEIPIVIDQFCQPNVYKRYLQTEKKTLPKETHFLTKAETYSIAVATASIIARSRFVEEMERLSKGLNMDLQKGASQKVDKQIATIMETHGEAILPSIAKVHFANTEKAKKYLV